MPGAVLHPEEVGATDAARVLGFVNAATSIDVLAETIGLSEGLQIGRRVAAAILAERDAVGGLRSLTSLMSVTGVTLSRFTEIVTALSDARPVRAGGRLRLTPANDTPWLGQSVGITGQFLDETRRGVPGALVTCIASSGVLSARAGLEQQKGSSVQLMTEPGGVVRFTWEPLISPPLPPASGAALEAELGRLDPKSETPIASAKALQSLAARYRSEGSNLIRTAIDRLFEAFPAEAQSPISPWSVMPVTLIAVAGGPEGRTELMTVATLNVRNWLAGWLEVLRSVVQGDTRLDEALKNLDEAARKGADLSTGIVRATQAFAGLELGAQGQKLRDEHAGHQVNQFLDRVAPLLKDQAIVNTVRAAGATGAAIQAGGFAVFETIRKVQSVGDTITKPGLDAGKFAGQLDRFGTRLDHLEDVAVDRTTFDSLKADLAGTQDKLGRLDTRLGGIAADSVTREDFTALQASMLGSLKTDLATSTTAIETRFDLALSGLQSEFAETVRTVQKDVGGLTRRLGELEEFQVDRATIKDLQTRLSAAQTQLGELETRVETVQADTVTRSDLTALDARLSQRLSKEFKEFTTSLRQLESDFGKKIDGLRAEFDGTVGGVRDDFNGRVAAVNAELGTRIDAKADATEVTGLASDVRTLKRDNQALNGRVDRVDSELRTSPTSPSRPIRPTR